MAQIRCFAFIRNEKCAKRIFLHTRSSTLPQAIPFLTISPLRNVPLVIASVAKQSMLAVLALDYFMAEALAIVKSAHSVPKVEVFIPVKVPPSVPPDSQAELPSQRSLRSGLSGSQ
jgi:hypothetical protein